MSFSKEKTEHYTIVRLQAERLDSLNAPELKAEFTLLGSDGVANVILDLEKVQYCDSSGLSSILVGNRLCKNSNGLLVLTGAQPTVKKLITISQLDTVLNMVPTVSEAIDFLFMASIENDLNETE
jgi:anti-sigma B factor antagonist